MKKSKVDSGVNNMSNKERVDYAILNDGKMTLDQVRAGVARDMQSLAAIVRDFTSPDVVEAVAGIYYARYLEYHNAKKAQTELDLTSNKDV